MKREPVTSSTIKSVGYDADTRTMHVEFSTGVYSYKNVPQEAYDGLMAAKSAVSFFAAQIRGKFESMKLQPAEKVPA